LPVDMRISPQYLVLSHARLTCRWAPIRTSGGCTCASHTITQMCETRPCNIMASASHICAFLALHV
jgi:hypothetical protein